ncbi:MAG TPA: hypothetical protein VFA94_16830 [Acidimicrobiales bacterium]|nr:hypothetical protein [Acidimicrobiales bacterium]
MGFFTRTASIVAVSLAVLIPQFASIAPAAATDGWAGGCVFTNAPVTYSPAVAPGPGAGQISINFTGTCAVGGSVGGGTLFGTLPGGSGACGSGAYSGPLTLKGPGQLGAGVTALATVVVGVDVVMMVLTSGITFGAVGTFVQVPTATVGCVTGTVTTAQWPGTLVFEDPTLDS